jgi:tripartite ATP-independent transporter DctP family solute receptor
MKRFKKIIIICVAVFMVLMLVSCGSSSQQSEKQQAESKDEIVTLKFGGTMSSEDIATEGMQRLADLASKKSNGTLKIEIFPASQLGDALTQLEGVATGSQDMFIEASSYMHSVVPEYDLLPYFFVFNSSEHYKKFTESELSNEFNQRYLEKTGVRILANNWLRAPRELSSKKPIHSIEDMKGLKVRVPQVGTSMINSYKALGANPTPVAWGETYLALQQGVVEACDAPLDSMYSMKFYEPTKRVVLTHHIYDSLSVFVNDSKFQSLSDNQKKALEEAAKETGEWYTKTVQESINEYITKIKEAGAEVVEIDTAPFKKAVADFILASEAKGELPAGLYEKLQALDK